MHIVFLNPEIIFYHFFRIRHFCPYIQICLYIPCIGNSSYSFYPFETLQLFSWSEIVWRNYFF